jgi:hypothetical protein
MHPPGTPTMNTCRHIKRWVLLLHQLKTDGHVAAIGGWQRLKVAEIGGGNGNMARLVRQECPLRCHTLAAVSAAAYRLPAAVQVGSTVGFGSWTIFDLPIMSQLQEWYLNATLAPRFTVRRNQLVLQRSGPARDGDNAAEEEEEGGGASGSPGGVQLIDTHHYWRHLAGSDRSGAVAAAGGGDGSEITMGPMWDVLVASHSWVRHYQ